jgi:hypothetical protein
MYHLLKRPGLFRCVVTRFALSKPSELGWDTSLMAIPRALTDKAPPMSFNVPYEELDVGHDWHYHYWWFEMSKPQVDDPSQRSNETESFILFKHLSLIRGEVILGRATRVLKA